MQRGEMLTHAVAHHSNWGFEKLWRLTRLVMAGARIETSAQETNEQLANLDSFFLSNYWQPA